MQRFFNFFLLLLLSSISFETIAQEGLPIINTYSVENYQAGVENWDAVQDNNGVMYFANSEGILEFDGLNWRLIQTENKVTIRSLAKTEAGIIYVGGDYELGRLEEDQNGQKNFVSLVKNCPASSRKYLSHVWKVIIHQGRKFFLASGAIIILDEQDKFVKILDENIYLRTFSALNGSLNAYSNSKGLLVLDDQALNFVSYSSDPFILNRSIEYLGAHPEKGVRIHIFDKGFFRVEKDKITKEDRNYPKLLDTDYIFCSGKNEELLFLGTTTNGLYAITNNGLKKKFHVRKDQGLNDNKIFFVYVGQDQNLWVCHENGLSYIEINAPVRLLNEKLGLNGTGYCSMILDSVLFVGTSHGLYSAPLDKEHDFYLFSLVKLIRQPIYFLHKMEGKLLIGGLHELMEYDGRELKVLYKGHHTNIQQLKNSVSDFLISTEKGFIHLYKDSGKLRVAEVTGVDDEILDFAFDSEGLIWFINHEHKIFPAYFNQESNSLTILKDVYQQQDLKFYSVTLFKNVLYAGTSKGLSFFHVDKKIFNSVSEKGDYNHPVTWLYNQENKDLWYEKSYSGDGKLFYRIDIVSDHDGVFKAKSINSVVHGNKAFSIGQFNTSELTIGTSLGFLLFNLKFSPEKITEAQTYIRRIRIADAEDTTIVKGLWVGGRNTYQFPLNNEVTEVEVDCASNYFYSRDKVLYSYKLEGWDENWSDWTDDNKIRYTITRDGEYTLRVRSTSNFNVEGKETSYTFLISKPWFKTYWWYSIEVGVLVLIMVVSVYLNRRGSTIISKASAFMIVLIILTVFEILSELVQDWIDAQGVTIFTLKIAINIVIALSINPIEKWIRRKLITNHFMS